MGVIDTLRGWIARDSVERLAQRLAAAEGEAKILGLRLAAARNKATASGVNMRGGRFEYEANSALRGSAKWPTLEKMTADARIHGSLNQAILPLVNADWEFEAASDDPRDEEIAEFCSAVLLRKGGDKYGSDYYIQTSWTAQRLPEILDMLVSGFAMFAKSWRVVGSKRVYDRLQWLEPQTVDPAGWALDDTDNIVAVKRTYQNALGAYEFREVVEAEALVLYVWDLLGARFEGRPYIRSSYGAWYRKDQFLRAALRWAARVGNGPPIGIKPAGWSNDAALNSAFESFIAELRGVPDEDAYGAFPRDIDGQEPTVKYVGSDTGDVDRMRGLVEGENREISHGQGTVTSNLGETTNGSRALGSTIGALEQLQVRAIANIVIEWETHGVANLVGPVEELVRTNFAGTPRLPKLVCRNLSSTEQTEHVPSIIDAIAKKALPAIPEIQYQIAERLGFEVPEGTFEAAAAEAKAEAARIASSSVASSPGQGGVASPDSDPAASSQPMPKKQDMPQKDMAMSLAAVDAFRQRVARHLQPTQPGAPKGALRYPLQIEADTVDLAAVRDTMRVGETDLMTGLRRAHRTAVDELVGRMKAGKVTRRNMDGLRRSRFRGASKAHAEMMPVADKVGVAGAQHVADEMHRQSPRASMATKKDAAAGGFAGVRVAGAKLSPAAIAEYADEAQVTVELNVSKIWSRLLDEALPEYIRLERSGLTGADLERAWEAFLQGLSEKPLEDMARQMSGVLYNQGRDVAITTAQTMGMADFVMRSEVLDSATCEACRTYDGKVVAVDSEEYDALMPPAGCEGGDRCRGFYVVLGKGLGE